MKPVARAGTLLSLIALASGCATAADARRLDDRVAEVAAGRDDVRAAQARAALDRAAMGVAIDGVAARLGAIDDATAGAHSALDDLVTRLADTGRALDHFARSIEQQRQETAGVRLEERYAGALALLVAGDDAGALRALRELVAAYPVHALAGDMQFWIAEIYYRARAYAEAADEFGRAIALAPLTKAPEASLKLALSRRQLAADTVAAGR